MLLTFDILFDKIISTAGFAELLILLKILFIEVTPLKCLIIFMCF